VEGTGTVELALGAKVVGEVVEALGDVGVVRAPMGLGDRQGAFEQDPGLRIVCTLRQVQAGLVQRPPDPVRLDLESGGMLGHHQDVGQQPPVLRPGFRVGVIGREPGSDHPQGNARPPAFLFLVELLVGDGLDEAVHAQRPPSWLVEISE
jgi:hypothetical protein